MEISKWWIHRPNSILILEMRQVCPRGANIYSDTQLVAANPRQDFLNHICVCMFVLFWVVGFCWWCCFCLHYIPSQSIRKNNCRVEYLGFMEHSQKALVFPSTALKTQWRGKTQNDCNSPNINPLSNFLSLLIQSSWPLFKAGCGVSSRSEKLHLCKSYEMV